MSVFYKDALISLKIALWGKSCIIWVLDFFFILGIVLSNTYRPYIYENHIFDFHLADTIGNLVAVPSLSLLLLAMRKYESLSKAILYSIFVFTLYEIIPFGTFDFYDLIATYISGLLTYLIFSVVQTSE